MANREEFILWWEEIENVLLHLATQMTRSEENAREIVQNVAVIAIPKIKDFVDQQHFSAWSKKQVRWLVLDDWKFAKRWASLEEEGNISVEAVSEERVFLGEVFRQIQELPE